MTKAPQIILIAGPSGSGKSTLTQALCRHFQLRHVPVTALPLDHYYRDLSHLEADQRADYNFDQPDAWEWERILRDVGRLKRGEATARPCYDFATHLRSEQTVWIHPTEVILLEGLFALCDRRLCEMADFKIYLEVDPDEALQRRIQRDAGERGRNRQSVIEQYEKTVRPAVEAYIRPSGCNAHLRMDGRHHPSDQIRHIASHLPELFNLNR